MVEWILIIDKNFILLSLPNVLIHEL